MIIIGADPGKTGALAMIDGDKLIDAIRIPYSGLCSPTRAWVVGGTHSETKFTVDIISAMGMREFQMKDSLTRYQIKANYIEEPSAGGNRHNKNAGVDASINRSFQGLLQAMGTGMVGQLYTVSVPHWQAQLFKVVPRAIESTDLDHLGIPGNNKSLTTKQRARLACLFQFGKLECLTKLKHTPRSSLLDSGRCDAACLALFGLLHHKQTPHLLGQSMAAHMCDLGIR